MPKAAIIGCGDVSIVHFEALAGMDDAELVRKHLDGDPDASHTVRCADCFSLLYWTGYGGKIRVPYGSLIDEPTLKPMGHMFVGSKAPWHEILDDLPQYDEYPWPPA